MLDKAVEAEIFKWLSGVDPSQYETDDVDDSAMIAEIEELEQRLAEWEAEARRGHSATVELLVQGLVAGADAGCMSRS
jgi:hypothetical protein